MTTSKRPTRNRQGEIRPQAVSGSITKRTQEPLLNSLVANKILTHEDLDRVREIHRCENGWIGRVLLNHGFCTRLELYQHWASCLGRPFVNLVASPPDYSLFRGLDISAMFDERWVPWRITDGEYGRTLVVATANPDIRLLDIAKQEFGIGRVTYVLTTDWDILQAVSIGAGKTVAHVAGENLAENRPHLSASRGPSWIQWLILAATATGMLGLMYWNRFVGLDVLLTILNIYFDASIATKLVFSLMGSREVRKEEEKRLRKLIEGGGVIRRRVPDTDLPMYTILVPCYREANVIPVVLRNIERLDYPRSKIQVLLLLEEDDIESVEAAKSTKTPDYMRIVVIPDGKPRTKARACNVGLSLARGELLVIYDAEDRPEPAQLRDVVDRFDELGPEFVCLQARLNYFNTTQNFLTRMFTLEYSLWFDYLLLGVDKLGLPMPLGGTSNHFRAQALRELGGWDPYNVTEDADLGIRCMALGYKVGTIESTTWEEACPEVKAWIRQRTRWIKGYMMTTTVHTRSFRQLKKTTGWRGITSLILFIGGTPATFLINPIVLAWGLYGVFGLPLPNFHLVGPITALNTFSLIFGNSIMIALSIMAVRRRRQWSLVGYALLNPVYWLLHSLAAWRALIQLIRKPSEWEKTPHGLSDVGA